MDLKFRINRQMITCINSDYAVSGSVDFTTAIFDFDSEWKDYEKSVTFTNLKTEVSRVVVLDNETLTCFVPWEVIENDGKLNVYVEGIADSKVASTAFMNRPLIITKNGRTEASSPADPTPDVYTQILERISSIQAGSISKYEIEEAVRDYLTKNPPQAITDEEIEAIVANYIAENKESLKGADGKDGKDGVDGKDGADGYSPTARVTQSGDTTTITITDKNGTTSATITASSDGGSGTVTLPSTGRAREIFEDVKVGWNLGNTFDATVTLNAGDADSLRRIDTDAEAPYYETCWGNVVTTKAMIDLVKSAGFNAVRVPITWAQHMYDDGNCTLSRKWVERLREIVTYVLDNDMYCIINTHHDCANYRESVGQGYLMLTGWLSCETTTYEEVAVNFEKVWINIATEFNDFDDRLMFEPFNELMSSRGWVSPNFEEYRVLNDLQQIFVDAVRSTGGNNLTRTLCVTTYQHGKYHLEWLEDPVDIIDNGFIYQVHDYDTNYNQDLDLTTYSYFIDNNIPLFINEMGTITDSLPYEIRVQHAQNFVARARELGIKCFWWDDGGNYVLMDRANTRWRFPEIVNALVLGTTTTPADTVFLVNQDMTDISYFQFNGLSTSTDSLGEFSNANSYGAICNTDAISLTGATYAQVKLTRADGYRIQSYALYDSTGTCITCKNTSTSTTNLIIETDGASSMRFVVYNPWGYRNLANFRTSMANEQLAIVVKIS